MTGLVDGPLTGGQPKAVELFVACDIADLSEYGLGVANNGGGTDGQEYTFSNDAASAGSFIYVANNALEFFNFFGFAATYTTAAVFFDGNDALELCVTRVSYSVAALDWFCKNGCGGRACSLRCFVPAGIGKAPSSTGLVKQMAMQLTKGGTSKMDGHTEQMALATTPQFTDRGSGQRMLYGTEATKTSLIVTQPTRRQLPMGTR